MPLCIPPSACRAVLRWSSSPIVGYKLSRLRPCLSPTVLSQWAVVCPASSAAGKFAVRGFHSKTAVDQASVRFQDSFLRTERIQGPFLRSNSNSVKV